MSNPYEVQTIRLTEAAACEAIAEAFNSVKDWKDACVSNMVAEIMKRLGFKK